MQCMRGCSRISPVKRFKRYQIFSAQLKTGDTVIQAAWFNMPFLQELFSERRAVYFQRSCHGQKRAISNGTAGALHAG